MGASIGRAGFSLVAILAEDRIRVSCVIRIGTGKTDINKVVFRALLEQRSSIEEAFGDELDWQERPTRSSCNIGKDYPEGRDWSEEDQWSTIHEWLASTSLKLEKALRTPIKLLNFQQ